MEKVWPPLRLRLLECLAGGGAGMRYRNYWRRIEPGLFPSGTLYLDLLEFGLEVPSRGGLPRRLARIRREG